ncbi:alpha/beta fold hydrolase [Streptomyces sp. NPDC055722]
MTTTPGGFPITRTAARKAGAATVLLIHGFLDDAQVWDGVVDALDGKAATVRYDLPGSGARADDVADPRDLSLEGFAAEADALLEQIDAPVIVAGQSMGSQVAELVAAHHADKVRGLVLLTPVPLGGTRLPDEVVAPFRALGRQADAQRTVRSQLSPALGERELDRLDRAGGAVAPDVVARYVDIWNQGVDDAPTPSRYTGPVLLLRGGADGFANQELVEAIGSRFAQADVQVVDGGGHWLHVEQPAIAASAILDFTDKAVAGTATRGWQTGFADRSENSFADGFAEDIVLEAAVLAKPIRGKALVAPALAAASSLYESLEFTEETTDGPTSYLQWRATAFGGVEIAGVTVLRRDTDGKIVSAAIHHRPLTAVLRFSGTLRDLLTGVIPADHFHGDHYPHQG